MTTTTPIDATKTVTIPPARRDERETSNGRPPPSAADPLPKAPALPIDLAGLSDELLALIAAEAQSEQQRRKDKREADFLAYVKEHAQALGIQTARLAAVLGKRARQRTDIRSTSPADGKRDGRSIVAPKFRDPKNPSQTWSGRGATPQWVAEHLAAGGKKEDLAIREDPE
jgi:DNA-binding protein H-NS